MSVWRRSARAGVRMMSGGSGARGDAAARSSRLPKFHTLAIPERVAALEKAGFLAADTRAALEGPGLALADANNMIENVLATFGVPMVSEPGLFLGSTRDGSQLPMWRDRRGKKPRRAESGRDERLTGKRDRRAWRST